MQLSETWSRVSNGIIGYASDSSVVKNKEQHHDNKPLPSSGAGHPRKNTASVKEKSVSLIIINWK